MRLSAFDSIPKSVWIKCKTIRVCADSNCVLCDALCSVASIYNTSGCHKLHHHHQSLARKRLTATSSRCYFSVLYLCVFRPHLAARRVSISGWSPDFLISCRGARDVIRAARYFVFDTLLCRCAPVRWQEYGACQFCIQHVCASSQKVFKLCYGFFFSCFLTFYSGRQPKSLLDFVLLLLLLLLMLVCVRVSSANKAERTPNQKGFTHSWLLMRLQGNLLSLPFWLLPYHNI